MIRLIGITTIGLVLCLESGLQAALIWIGGSVTDSNISTLANWNPAQNPLNNDLIFSGNQRTSPLLTADLTILSVTFDSNADPFTLGGAATFTIKSGGITNNDADDQTINTAFKLSAAQTWTANTGNLIVGGDVNKNGNGLTIDGAADTDLNGLISGGGTFKKDGAGTLTIGGNSANTFSGASQLNEGSLMLNKTASLNAFAGAFTIGDGVGGASADILRLLASNQMIDTKSLTIENSGLLDINGFFETVGQGTSVTLRGGKIEVGDGGSLTIANTLNLSTANGTIETGTGTVILQGTINGNTASSTHSISGNVSLDGAERTFGIDGNVTLAIDAAISNGSMLKTGGGTLALSGANTFAGGIDHNNGIITVGHDQALGTGTLDLGGSAEVQAAGGARVVANAVTLTGTGDHTIGGSQDLTFSGDVTLPGHRKIVVDNTGITTISGIVKESAGTSRLTKRGLGTLVLAGANTHTAGIDLETGSLGVANNSAVGPGHPGLGRRHDTGLEQPSNINQSCPSGKRG